MALHINSFSFSAKSANVLRTSVGEAISPGPALGRHMDTAKDTCKVPQPWSNLSSGKGVPLALPTLLRAKGFTHSFIHSSNIN